MYEARLTLAEGDDLNIVQITRNPHVAKRLERIKRSRRRVTKAPGRILQAGRRRYDPNGCCEDGRPSPQSAVPFMPSRRSPEHVVSEKPNRRGP